MPIGNINESSTSGLEQTTDNCIADKKYQAQIVTATAFLKNKCMENSFNPKIVVVCGSGLTKLCDSSSIKFSLSYSEIPHFAKPTVEGHSGRLVFGVIGNIECIFMVGRFHYYEGYTMKEVTFPIRVFSSLDIRHLIVTNAAGGINESYKVGDIMIIEDHINLLAFSGVSPLTGPNLGSFGPRFPPMTHPYDAEMISNFLKIAENAGQPVHRGTYINTAGPSYETKAEIRMFRMVGADAVGMSTIPEVVVGVHCGMKVFGLSLITNKCVTGLELASVIPPSHQEVLAASEKSGKVLESLIHSFIENMKL